MILKAPFPYFGGKSRAAALVWPRFGVVRNYVEPFMGSAAVLLARPDGWTGTETVNDADGLLCNFWRALKANPAAVAQHADWPVNENDLHARHAWLVGHRDSLQARLEGDPSFYDAKVAGWWVWGTCCWIGSGFCSGNGPWAVRKVDGVRQLVHLGNAGQGVNRNLVHLGDAGQGVNRQRVHLGNAGQGVNRQLVYLGAGEPGTGGKGIHGNGAAHGILDWFNALSDRLARVRVCCGDWSRVCTPTPTVKQGLTAVFLDPPYADTAQRALNLYRMDSDSIAHDVREWALEHGDDPRMRIALCGYEGEHKMPKSWTCVPWKAIGGYGSQAAGRGLANSHRERIWFSKSCLKPATARLAKAKQAKVALCG
jgi:hypothetical protein